jgi:putative glutamine amidotransferase
MDRPVIGLCTALERARWSVWDQQAFLLPRSYVDAVQRAGGVALMLPPDERAIDDPDPLLDLLDGLILAGGADIDPDAYGDERHAETAGTVPERDTFEIALTRRAFERDLPLLGICRGMQLMNVARGGTLLQHLPESHGHHEHRRNPGSFDGADHDVRLAEGSLAARAAGETTHGTKSHHHQGVGRLGEGLEVTGWSTLDELPEAIEVPGSRFALGVQWHPEADETSRLIEALVAEAAAAKAAASASPLGSAPAESPAA